MKTLILMRHGKSSWDYEVSDKDRPLKERGISDAYLVAGEFVKTKPHIDAVYSSPANRALHTCIIALRKMGLSLGKLHLTEDLYDFSGGSVLGFLKKLDNTLETVMIFGHNHAFTHIANSLGNSYIDNVPTSGLVRIDFDVADWAMADSGETVLELFPKELK